MIGGVIGYVRAEIASRPTISVKDSICCKYRSKMMKGWNRGVYSKSCAISARTPPFTFTIQSPRCIGGEFDQKRSPLPEMNMVTWSKRERVVARRAFENAYANVKG
jgi:hypothetical protein